MSSLKFDAPSVKTQLLRIGCSIYSQQDARAETSITASSIA